MLFVGSSTLVGKDQRVEYLFFLYKPALTFLVASAPLNVTLSADFAAFWYLSSFTTIGPTCFMFVNRYLRIALLAPGPTTMFKCFAPSHCEDDDVPVL